MKRILFLLLIVCLFLPSLYAEDMRVVINSGHTGAVHSIAVSERENLLFSSGEDGTIRAWDTDTKKLVSLIQISHYPILKLVLHPSKPIVAVVQKNGINSYQLSVWNWKQKSELYSKDLDELPLHIDYSPKGSYLVYSKTSWDSLTFLQSDTGRQLRYLSQGFGIVSHFAISPSENTIITYSVSGRIDYYDIQRGEKKYSFKTLSDLTKICFTANLRFMAASDTERFLLIDLTNGKLLTSLEQKNISTIAANNLTGEFLSIYPAAKDFRLHVLNVSTGEIVEREIASLSDITPDSGVYYLNTLYIPKASGDISYFLNTPDAREETIVRNTLAPITNLSFFDTRMAFAAGDKVFFIDSDFFLGGRKTSSPSFFNVYKYDTPFSPPISVTSTNDGNFLLWQQQPGIVSYIDGDNGEIGDNEVRFESDLIQVTAYDDSFLALESNGTCSFFSLPTLTKNFSYAGFGIKTAALAENTIFLGKSRASGFNSSILSVNYNTGETVPVFDSSMLIYEARYQKTNNKIYALAIERDGESAKTVLKSFQYPSFSRGMELLSYDGEDLTAHIALDQESWKVYTTLGFNGITVISGRSESKYRQKEHIPRRVFVEDDFLYTINTDFSITIWSKDTGKQIMNFYMFTDLEWVALLTGGQYYASSGAAKYIGVYDGINRVPFYKTRSLRLN